MSFLLLTLYLTIKGFRTFPHKPLLTLPGLYRNLNTVADTSAECVCPQHLALAQEASVSPIQDLLSESIQHYRNWRGSSRIHVEREKKAVVDT